MNTVKQLHIYCGSIESQSVSFSPSVDITKTRHRAPMGPDGHYIETYTAPAGTVAVVTTHRANGNTTKTFTFA
jgi:hypothetical protein